MDVTKRRITKISREVNKFTIRMLRGEGIGTSEFEVIHAIRKNPGITQAGVRRITGMDKGAIARQTASLEAKGYLIRAENPADGRSQLLFATEKAECLKLSKERIESQFYEWLMEPLPECDREEFSRMLDVLYQRCKEESRAGFPQMQKIVKGGERDEG